MTTPNLRSQRGQQVVEAILILVVFMGITTLVTSYFNRDEFLKKLIQTPFVNLAGMMQNGVWASRDTGAAQHPSAHPRHILVEGDKG